MATVRVSHDFDMRTIDFDLQGPGRTAGYNALDDVYVISSSLGAYAPEQIQIRGTNLTFDGGGNLTGGTITRFDYIGPYDTPADDPPFYQIYDLSLPTTVLLPLYDLATGVIDLPGLRAAMLGGDDNVRAYPSVSSRVYLMGYGGNDTVVGSEGNDSLNGGLGVDKLYGGRGNDVYFVNSSLDRVDEDVRKGVDTVRSTSNFTLPPNVENLVLTGVNNVAGTGNGLTNHLFGNVGNNRLIGGFRNDTLVGAGGDDTLIGGGSNDRLTGGSGADVMRFGAALHATRNVDTLTDFESGVDRLELDDAVFTAIGAVGALLSTAFRAGAAATTAAHRVIYDAATGHLSYDADGSGAGAAVLFAQLTPGTALAATDITVI